MSKDDPSRLTGAVITDATSADELTLKLLITSQERDEKGAVFYRKAHTFGPSFVKNFFDFLIFFYFWRKKILNFD